MKVYLAGNGHYIQKEKLPPRMLLTFWAFVPPYALGDIQKKRLEMVVQSEDISRQQCTGRKRGAGVSPPEEAT